MTMTDRPVDNGVNVQALLDARTALSADPGIRNGFEDITVRFSIDAGASRDELEALLAQAQKRSAVFDVVTNPTTVLVELA